MQGLADFLLEGELSWCMFLFILYLNWEAAFIISGTHKNNGQAVRTYLFRFYTAMTIYLISVTLINSSAFIFP